MPLASRNSSREITPSDFKPACTVTHSLSISIITPVTIEPGFISTVFRLSSNSSAKESLITQYLFKLIEPVACLYRASSRHGSSNKICIPHSKLECAGKAALKAIYARDFRCRRPLAKTLAFRLVHYAFKHICDGRGAAVDNNGVFCGSQGGDFAASVTRISLLYIL